METITLSNFKLYIDEVSFEDERTRAGAVCALVAKPFARRVECEPWSISKGQLDHVWAARERAHALIRLMYRLVRDGVLTDEEAEDVIRRMGWGWHCSEHPLIPLSGPYDVCFACVEVE